MKVHQTAGDGGSKAKGCSCSVASGGTPSTRPLNKSMRLARVGAGIAFIAVGRSALRRTYLWPLAAVAGWFGISHVVAGATGFAGCPELGAIPSLVLQRDIHTRCGPWERIDSYLGRA